MRGRLIALGLGGALAFAAAASGRTQTKPSADVAATRVTVLADGYLAAYFETFPRKRAGTASRRRLTGAYATTRCPRSRPGSDARILYAERVADEMGAYSSDVDLLGLLASESARAARLVIDAGIHARGMTRPEAVAYLRAHTTRPPNEVEGEVNRYISWPGQATSYMLGAVEIRRLRDQAQLALGSLFDIRGFHDLVLDDGNVTLPMLKSKIERWIAAQASKPSPTP